MPEPSGATAGRDGDTWVWDAGLGVYFHGGSGTYALPGSGGEWRYLSMEEMAQRSDRESADIEEGGAEEKEEGEIEDDVGWGALMDPEKEKEARQKKNPVCDQAFPGRNPDPYGRETYADGTPVDGDPLLAHEAEGDPSAHLLRLVVKRSQVLEIGAVAVLDARPDGTQIGRDRGSEPRVRIKEMEVSKTHALIFYAPPPASTASSPTRYGSPARRPAPEEAPTGWFVTDLGSTLGTYVAHAGEAAAARLSAAKCASRPHALRHGDRLTVGRTTFAVHVHGDWPCGACQMSGNAQLALEGGRAPDPPSQAQAPPQPFELDTFAASGNGTRKGRQALKRRREMDALRGNLLGADGEPRPRAAGYVDRSAQRRRLHPPSPPRHRDTEEEARPAAAAPAGPSEAARKLLAMQGWSEGQGLGRTPGRAEPIVPVVRSERAGLGTRGQVAEQPGEVGDWRQRGRQRRWDEISK